MDIEHEGWRGLNRKNDNFATQVTHPCHGAASAWHASSLHSDIPNHWFDRSEHSLWVTVGRKHLPCMTLKGKVISRAPLPQRSCTQAGLVGQRFAYRFWSRATGRNSYVADQESLWVKICSDWLSRAYVILIPSQTKRQGDNFSWIKILTPNSIYPKKEVAR
jgi:hypothetical protein